MVSRALLQTVLKKLNKLEPRMRLGGHNMGRAPALLGAFMQAIEATIVEHVEKCETKPAWSTKEGGGGSIKRNAFDIFDQHNTAMLVNDRSAFKFEADLSTDTDLSPLGIDLAPHIRDILKHLNSCLHQAGVARHPAVGAAEAFAKSTAPFKHGRPDGLEEMGDSFVEEVRLGACTSASCSLERAALLTRTRTRSAAIPASSCWLSTPERAV
jgi:hypothetical protein